MQSMIYQTLQPVEFSPLSTALQRKPPNENSQSLDSAPWPKRSTQALQ